MSYVSCMVAPPDPLEAERKPAGQQRITCLDDQGRTWWLTEDSQVGDWLEYKAKGGEVAPYVEIETQPAPGEEPPADE